MDCPRCGKTYDDGVAECPDCGVALRAALPSSRTDDPPLVAVCETGDAVRTVLIKSFLEDAQIPYLARNDQLQDLFGFGRLVPVNPISGPVIFMVPEEYADEARDLLARLDEQED